MGRRGNKGSLRKMVRGVSGRYLWRERKGQRERKSVELELGRTL